MNGPVSEQLLVGSVGTGVQELVRLARQLGITWRLLPARCVEVTAKVVTRVVVDGDGGGVPMPATSLIGEIPPQARVMTLLTGEGGVYVIGWYGPAPEVLRPGAVVAQLRRTAAQPIAGNAALVDIAWDTVDYDRFGTWSAVGNPQRYRPAAPGLYVVYGGVGYAGSSGGSYRDAIASRNGSAQLGSTGRVPPGSVVPAARPVLAQCNGVSDYVGILARHDHTSSIDTNTTGSLVPSMLVIYAGPA